jgi:hypothetical protein
MVNFLPYSPGPLPTKPPPQPGESITINLVGLPPYKDTSRSIRNINHPRYDSYIQLRLAAIRAMNGRAWYRGPIQLDLKIRAPRLHKNRSISDYVSGIADSLDGSHGPTFTYLPIVYEDDCQIAIIHSQCIESKEMNYTVTIIFIGRD